MKRGTLSAVMDILLPRTCIVCGRRLLFMEEHICLECLAGMPLTYFWGQRNNPMSERLNEIIQRQLDQEDSSVIEPFAHAAALFLYHSEDRYKLIPYHIKYKGDMKAGEYFGRMLGRRLLDADIWRDADVIIPVPLHWSRRFARGYNQAEAIASGVASSMGIPLRTDLLIRKRRTRTQTRLDMKSKQDNVSRAFEVSRSGKDYLKDNPEVRHIVLVDDVCTTGSTLHACFVALREAFPPEVRISVATLAFVGGA